MMSAGKHILSCNPVPAMMVSCLEFCNAGARGLLMEIQSASELAELVQVYASNPLLADAEVKERT
jgi:hypothetical protein